MVIALVERELPGLLPDLLEVDDHPVARVGLPGHHHLQLVVVPVHPEARAVVVGQPVRGAEVKVDREVHRHGSLVTPISVSDKPGRPPGLQARPRFTPSATYTKAPVYARAGPPESVSRLRAADSCCRSDSTSRRTSSNPRAPACSPSSRARATSASSSTAAAARLSGLV